MFDAVKQLAVLMRKTDKLWLLPIFLFLIIVALLIVGAQMSPVPIFLYPLI